MHIACIQYDPIIGQVQANMNKVEELIDNLTEPRPDFLILPEMTFTGYVFESQDEIRPFLEPSPALGKATNLDALGASVSWAVRGARTMNCWIVVGFPELITEASDLNSATNSIGYNSCAVINPNGDIVHIYRKYFLYEAEVGWARSGPGFTHFELPNIGRAGIGICMDLNDDTARPESFSQCEFASYHLSSNTQLIFALMNWLKSEELTPNTPSSLSILYWVSRLRPIIIDLEPGNIVYVVTCNRIGTERGTTFTGTTCVLELSCDKRTPRSLSPSVLSLRDIIIEEMNLARVNMNYLYYLLGQTADILDRVHLIAALPHDTEGSLQCFLDLPCSLPKD